MVLSVVYLAGTEPMKDTRPEELLIGLKMTLDLLFLDNLTILMNRIFQAKIFLA